MPENDKSMVFYTIEKHCYELNLSASGKCNDSSQEDNSRLLFHYVMLHYLTS